MKWYSKHYGKDKEAERKKEAEKMYEHEFDYESDWEDVGEEVEVEGDDGDFELESENECTPTGQTDNLPGGAGKKKPKNNKQGVKDDDAWVTETEELLSKIRKELQNRLLLIQADIKVQLEPIKNNIT
jgi:hypothetical protein